MKTILFSASLLWLTACATTVPSQTTAINPASAQEAVSAPLAPKVVELGGMTNEAAAQRLYQALLNANYLATLVSPLRWRYSLAIINFCLSRVLIPLALTAS